MGGFKLHSKSATIMQIAVLFVRWSSTGHPGNVSTCYVTEGIGRPYRSAKDRLFWRDKICPARA